MGARLEVHQARGDPQRIAEICRDADGILVQYGPLTAEAIEGLARCRIIVSYGIGYDSIDAEAATRRGIPVANVPRFCVEEVSDHAIMLLLAAAKKLAFQNRQVKDRTSPWDYDPIQPVHRLQGRTLGIVGLGKIGKRVAAKAKGLGPEGDCMRPLRGPRRGGGPGRAAPFAGGGALGLGLRLLPRAPERVRPATC